MTTLMIESNEILKQIKIKNEELYNNFLAVYRQIEPLLNNRISMVFPNYTLHDINHSLRIMKYMEKLIPDLDKLNEFELVLLAYSALLHDIGMAASEQEIENIENGSLKYQDLDYQAVLKKYNGDHLNARQDFIRRVHAYRSGEYIKNNLREYLYIPQMINTSFEDQLALICQSHTEDITWIKQNLDDYGQKGEYTYNSQFCAIILRLADILDFDSQRTPPILFDSISPKGVSKEEWVQHFSIENVEKIKNTHNGYKLIEFHGRCSDPFIHRKILSYIEWINNEINNANDLSQGFSETYRLFINPKVYNLIKSEGYTIADMKFKVNYNQITKLLMGDNLYGDKKFGLRELIQNSIDACKLKKEIIDKKREFGDEEYKGLIKLILDKEKNEVIIKDNGIGMNIHILKNYFLKLGASFYNSDDYSLKGYNYKPIGNYGIGFLASFMLSDEVKVKTRHLNGSLLYEVDLNKFDEFVCINHNPEYQDQGTEVILNYNQFMETWKDFDNIKNFLRSHFLTDELDIQYINKEEHDIININNSLWNKTGKHNIRLSDYLNDIDGNVILSQDFEFIFDRNIEDIYFKGEPYIFDGKSLFPLDEYPHKLNLSDFLIQEELRVLNFPIIEDMSALDNIMKFIDDEEEAWDTYIKKFNPHYITIIAKEELMDDALTGYIEFNQEILPNLYLNQFEDNGLDSEAYTLIELEKLIIYNLPGIPLYLSVSTEGELDYIYRNDFELYVRNIFVKKISLDIQYKLNNIKIKNVGVNVLSSDILPNITRNDLNKDILKQIKQAVYIAICFYVHENLIDELQKQTLLGYIKNYLPENNKFIKNNSSY